MILSPFLMGITSQIFYTNKAVNVKGKLWLTENSVGYIITVQQLRTTVGKTAGMKKLAAPLGVVIMKGRCWQNASDISAEEAPAQKGTWVPQKDENIQRTRGLSSSSRKGQKKAFVLTLQR